MNNRKEKSIKYNFIMNVILSISAVLFPLITFPYVSRILLPEGTGKVAFATSLIYYFSMVAQLGIPMYGVNACAKVRDDRIELSRVSHEILLINMTMTVAAYAGLAVVLLCFPSFYAERTLYIIVSLNIVFDTIAMEWLYKAMEQYDYITVRSLIFKTLAVIATFLLVHNKEDYHIYSAITVFAALATGVINFLNARKFIEVRYIGGYNVKRHLKPVVVFFLILCASTVCTHMDTLMLGILKSEVDVGYYNVSLKVRNILVSVVASLGTVLLPRTSYYVERGMMEEFKAICSKAIRFVCIVAIPLCVFFILFAKESVYFLSGPEYEISIIPMQILMPTLFSIGICNIFETLMLVPLGKEKIILKSTAAGAAVNLVANALLIPRYASVGAAIATLTSELMVMFIQGFTLKQDIIKMFVRMPHLKIVIALFLASLGSIWIKLLRLGNFGNILASATIFFGVYFITLIIEKEPFILENVHQLFTMIEKFKRKINLRK